MASAVLKVANIDNKRMIINISEVKGRILHRVILAPKLLDRMRSVCRYASRGTGSLSGDGRFAMVAIGLRTAWAEFEV